MIQFFVYWLEKCCGIDRARLKLRVGINESFKDKVEEIEQFWLELLRIPRDQFQKPFFQKVIWKKVYDHPETYHGVLRIRVTKSIDLLRTILGWIDGLKRNSLTF